MAMALADIAGVSVPTLFDALGHSDLVTARAVSLAFAAAARAPLIAVLAEKAATATGDKAAQRRATALRGLAQVSAGRDRCTTHVAASCLANGGADVRCAAASALGRAACGLGSLSDLAVTHLGKALGDPDEQVSVAAARALPRLVSRGNQVAIDAAHAHLHHRLPWARRSALTVLAELAPCGDAVTVSAAIAAVRNDMDWRVRAAAARTLARVALRGNTAVCMALEAGMRDSHVAVRRVAAGAIVHVAAQPSAPFRAVLNQSPPARPHRRKREESPPPVQRRRGTFQGMQQRLKT